MSKTEKQLWNDISYSCGVTHKRAYNELCKLYGEEYVINAIHKREERDNIDEIYINHDYFNSLNLLSDELNDRLLRCISDTEDNKLLSKYNLEIGLYWAKTKDDSWELVNVSVEYDEIDIETANKNHYCRSFDDYVSYVKVTTPDGKNYK